MWKLAFQTKGQLTNLDLIEEQRDGNTDSDFISHGVHRYFDKRGARDGYIQKEFHKTAAAQHGIGSIFYKFQIILQNWGPPYTFHLNIIFLCTSFLLLELPRLLVRPYVRFLPDLMRMRTRMRAVTPRTISSIRGAS